MSRQDWIPTWIVLLVGAPLCFLFARAMLDGELRRRQAPVRAFLGNQAFDALQQGEKTQQHYMGDSLRAPDFTLPDRQGNRWSLEDHRGKVVVLNFWSVTCQPCIEEMPSLDQLAQMMQDNPDVEVVAVSTDDGWNAVQSVVPPNTPLKILFDPDKSVVRGKFGTRLYPETWIIDRDGVIRLRVDGPRDWSSALAVSVIEQYL